MSDLKNRDDGAAAEQSGSVGRHTPGPWRVVRGGIISDDREIVIDALLLPEEARLIAAAPDLLEAIKEIRDQTIAIQHSQEVRLNDIFDIATAAIRKATGAA